ncbi:type I restriction-modification system subunit M [Ruminiclostridium cellobioparum]|uniref:type I restriction-modification system subunit M n=1 Tax=Ruminiclostridium cellobioparum TaxID=29355 RepID=UPI0028A757D5|nr:class I SAM-dependent DNA methyltransferase [Ruminiclostridium cellobioparum]
MAVMNSTIEKKLWDAADALRTNSRLKSSEYATPVLGLIFLRFADYRFTLAKERIDKQFENSRRQPSNIDYQRLGVLYIPDESRYSYLLNLPESEDIQKAVITAMKGIEEENPNADLKDALPKQYTRIPKEILISLLKTFSEIDMEEHNGDTFGAIYEYFLGKFALSEGQKGGEFFTPNSLVRLIVEILEPNHGLLLDPACGSGGMFVQSAKFVNRHSGNSESDISIYGQENILDTVKLCKMNLAVHGIQGDIKLFNTYYQNVHGCYNRMNYVMANPPFNAKGVDKERIKGDKRYPFGIPSNDNANYLWIQEFYSAMKPGEGKAGFVMANSAADAKGSELEIRKQLIQKQVVDVMISIGSNFFYTVTLPCALWFFDNHKTNHDRKDTVLFIDARNTFTQIDRAHREFSDQQIEYLANIVRMYHNKDVENTAGSSELLHEQFPGGIYQDVPGLCKVATIEEIETQGWSLNPGRYVGTQTEEFDEEDFWEVFTALNAELQKLNNQSQQLERTIEENFQLLVGGNA